MMLPPLWSPEVEARVQAEARDMDKQERAPEVKFCTRCVVSSQRPRIVFDDEGVCSACRYAERKKAGIDWKARADELRALLAKYRKDHAYDVIVPCSGGKDSSTVAYRLKHEFGMTPLCIKWAPHIYTEIGRRNMENFNHAGFDVIEATPNGLLHRKLARLGLEFYGDPFLPFIYGQLAWPMNAAKWFGIPLVFYGENGEAEYGGDPAANDKPCWSTEDWTRVYMKGASFEKLLFLGRQLGAISEQEQRQASMFYRLPDFDREFMGGFGPTKETRPQFHWLGYYLPWHPQGNYYHAAEHTGFEANEERSQGTYSKYASLDDKLDGLHYYLGYIKFGIGRCTSDAAHEVRDGEIGREEAVALVGRYDGEFPTRHLDDCLAYLGMDRMQLDRVIDRFRPEHLWERTHDEGWRLKHTVYADAKSEAA